MTSAAPAARRRAREATVLTGVAALLLVLGVVWWRDVGPLAVRERCTATAGGRSVSLDPEQARHAATIAAVAVRRDLPARAVTIALATAYQESDLRNLPGGDRDSRGLFQQRPSQGWGTPQQVTDPVYAAGAFYDALVEVPGYRDLDVTVAAQRVQRSAFPDAYRDHENDARVLASALTGNSPAALTCSVRPGAYAAEVEGDSGLTPRARQVLDEVEDAFGDLPVGGFARGGVSNGHVSGSSHYDGRAVDVFFRPHQRAESRQGGWALAHWLVANADRLGVATVIYDDRIWSVRRSAQGWRDYVHPSGNREDPVLRHLDHVHVDVARGS